MKKLAGGMALTLLLTTVGVSQAVPLYFADTQFGNTVNYTMDLTGSGLTYTGVFTVDVTGDALTNWWAGSFDFKFDTGSVNDSLTINQAGWTAWDGSNDPALWNGKSNGQVSSRYTFTRQGTGFYLSVLAPPYGDELLNANYQNGVHVSAGGTTAIFNFSLTLNPGSSLRTDAMPFQVVYYDGLNSSGKVLTTQLSNNLSQVPEPSTLLLIGSGLLGLGLMRRRRSG